MKRDMFDYVVRLEELESKDSDLYGAFKNLMHKNDLYEIICEDQLREFEHDEDAHELVLEIGLGAVDFEMYHNNVYIPSKTNN